MKLKRKSCNFSSSLKNHQVRTTQTSVMVQKLQDKVLISFATVESEFHKKTSRIVKLVVILTRITKSYLKKMYKFSKNMVKKSWAARSIWVKCPVLGRTCMWSSKKRTTSRKSSVLYSNQSKVKISRKMSKYILHPFQILNQRREWLFRVKLRFHR